MKHLMKSLNHFPIYSKHARVYEQHRWRPIITFYRHMYLLDSIVSIIMSNFPDKVYVDYLALINLMNNTTKKFKVFNWSKSHCLNELV